MGAVFGTELQQIFAVELHLATSDGVGWVAGEHGTESALAAAVGTHDGVHLSRFNGEVHTF